MRSIKKLFDDLNNSHLSLNKRYPELLDAPAGNIKILYLGAMLNKAGIYRSILPKLELAKHGYSIIVNSILKDYDGNNFIEHYDLIVKKDLLAWANYIILPASTDDISPLVEDIKKVNRHAIICMDLDKNYHKLSQYTNEAVFYTVPRQKKLINNLTQCDAIIAADPSIADFYDTEIKKIYPDAKPIFLILGNYLSLNLFEDMLTGNKSQEQTEPKAKTSDIFHVLIYSERTDYTDINSNREILIWLQRIYPQAKLTVFGRKPVWKTKNGLRNVPHEFIEAKSIFDQYKQLHSIKPDIVFIPINTNRIDMYYRSNFKLLELCALGIPVMTYHVPPYSDFDTFVNCGETKNNIQSIFHQLIKSQASLPEMGKKAHEHAWGNCSYESEGIVNYIKNTLK